MGIGDEIHHSMKSLDHPFIHSAYNHFQESFFHILVFVPYPLRKYWYSGLEVVKGRVLCHALEVAVDFIAFSICCCYAPTDEMVFEEALTDKCLQFQAFCLLPQNFNHLLMVSWFWPCQQTMFVVWHQASWALAFYVAGNKALLWKVSDICCKDGIHFVHPPIGTYHIQPFLTHGLQQFQ